MFMLVRVLITTTHNSIGDDVRTIADKGTSMMPTALMVVVMATVDLIVMAKS